MRGVRLISPIINLDDPLEALMPRESSRDTVVEDLKIWSKRKKGMWVSVKYRAHNLDYTKLSDSTVS